MNHEIIEIKRIQYSIKKIDEEVTMTILDPTLLVRSLPRQNIKLDHFYYNVIRGLLADLNVDLIFTCQVTPQTPDRRDV